MVTHSYYELDNRVRRYAEALAKRGDHVEVIAIGRNAAALKEENIEGVTVHRIQNRKRDERGKWTYAWRMLRFLVSSAIFLTRRHWRVRYDLIHVHNMPDFLVFAAWYPKWTGAKLILDIHDIMPELFANKFHAGTENRYVRLLQWIEKSSAAFVDHVIVSNDLWREKLIARSVPKEKSSVFLNHVDPAIFYRRARTRTDERLIIVFPGTFQRHQGLDVAVEALAHLKDILPAAELHLYGGGDAKPELTQLADQLGLSERVRFFEGVPLDRVADVIANADIGVVPKRADSFGNEAYSTKIMEFMSQGVPAVVSRTKIDEFYFNEKVVRFFDSGDSKALAAALLDVAGSKALRDSLVKGGLEYVDQHGWHRRRNDYFQLIDSLTTDAPTRSGTREYAAVLPE